MIYYPVGNTRSSKIIGVALRAAALSISFSFAGCGLIDHLAPGGLVAPPDVSENKPVVIHRESLKKPVEFDTLLKENEAALTSGKTSNDVALYNIGVLSSDASNPKKNYGKALSSFKRLIQEFPQSPLAEPTKTWIHVLEQHQTMTEEKQKLSDEKRLLIREREQLSQEREKLKYIIEKSRQIDTDIEKKRRSTRSR